MKKASSMQLKNIRVLLKEKKARDFEGLFVAEGEKIVRDAALKGHSVDSVFVSRAFAESAENGEFILGLEKKGVPVFLAADSKFDKISSLQHSQGVLAVIKKPDASRNVFPGSEGGPIVLCDGIQDPGNLGTIVRTSAAMGVSSVMLVGDCADIFNPKVVRASSGAVLDVPVSEFALPEVDRLKQEGYRLFASRVSGKKSADISGIKDIPVKCIVAFGSEGRGISPEILDRADQLFFIPTSEKVESLNVTSAVAITLYAIRRGK
ncbi:MAG: RNA methyltransferase [Candidatus Omnitrophota bacterium]